MVATTASGKPSSDGTNAPSTSRIIGPRWRAYMNRLEGAGLGIKRLSGRSSPRRPDRREVSATRLLDATTTLYSTNAPRTVGAEAPPLARPRVTWTGRGDACLALRTRTARTAPRVRPTDPIGMVAGRGTVTGINM